MGNRPGRSFDGEKAVGLWLYRGCGGERNHHRLKLGLREGRGGGRGMRRSTAG
ncbi:hypothetical protein KSP40_PGU000006 [Platanthera guangdongensis]|uniref:Uncharacterized protein n=1 Tax=Platanthera guangdongensis TaxID=2320717 RepID=A0ABR2LU43_9ASPA